MGPFLTSALRSPFSRSVATAGSDLTASGGVVAPMGNKFGTLVVGGDLLFNGGTFLTAFDSLGNSNLLYVCDKATLAPAAELTSKEATGNFIKGQTISLLEAEDGLTGTFGTVSLPLGGDGLSLFEISLFRGFE